MCKIKGNTHFVKVVLSKVSLQYFQVGIVKLVWSMVKLNAKSQFVFESRQNVPFVVLGHSHIMNKTRLCMINPSNFDVRKKWII